MLPGGAWRAGPERDSRAIRLLIGRVALGMSISRHARGQA